MMIALPFKKTPQTSVTYYINICLSHILKNILILLIKLGFETIPALTCKPLIL